MDICEVWQREGDHKRYGVGFQYNKENQGGQRDPKLMQKNPLITCLSC